MRCAAWANKNSTERNVLLQDVNLMLGVSNSINEELIVQALEELQLHSEEEVDPASSEGQQDHAAAAAVSAAVNNTTVKPTTSKRELPFRTASCAYMMRELAHKGEASAGPSAPLQPLNIAHLQQVNFAWAVIAGILETYQDLHNTQKRNKKNKQPSSVVKTEGSAPLEPSPEGQPNTVSTT